MQTISLGFKGYWRECKKNGLPGESGIYCVYRCIHNVPETDGGKSSVALKELLYIGESKNIHDRVRDHDRFEDWKKHLEKGETLCYSYALVGEEDRERAEAALIFHHGEQLPENTEHKDHFGYPATKMVLSGETRFLDTDFTVEADD